MSGALVFIQNDTTKKTLWVSADNPLPVTFGGSSGVAGLVQVTGVNGTAVATDANYFPVGQTTASRLNAQVVGAVAHDAVYSGNPLLTGGYASSAAPTAVSASGDAVRAWYGLNGQTVSTLVDGSGNAVHSTTAAAVVGNTNCINVASFVYKYNGTNWNKDNKPNITKRIASSAASGNPDFLKASAGELVQFWGQNGAAITYIQIYNKASAPTIGTDTPILTFPVAANERFNITIPGGGYYFSTGVAYAFTTDAAATTGAGAAAVTACNIIGA